MPSTREFRVPLGRSVTGALVAPADLVAGEHYLCPACGDPLVVRTGSKVRTHFAHKASSTCSGESVLHHTAKLLIQEAVEQACAGRRQIVLVMRCEDCGATSETNFPGHTVDRARLEQRLPSGRIVDVLLTRGEVLRLAVEIHVTHAVDDAKAADLGIAWVELSGKDVLKDPFRWIIQASSMLSSKCRRCRKIKVVYEEHVSLALQNAGMSMCPPGYTVKPVDCYRCGAVMPVFRWGDDRFSPTRPPDPVPPILRLATTRLGGAYWAHHCPKCNTLQGDHHLRTSVLYYAQDIIEAEVDRDDEATR
jgi:ssDNA-binding Zn-finger/Zn-ribbon topoisomerase 1